MNPDEGLYRWKTRRLLTHSADVAIKPGHEPFELQISGMLAGLHIEGRDDRGNRFVVAERSGRPEISTSEDSGRITYRSSPLALTKMRLFFDRGIIEAFANKESVCGTRRSYAILDPTELTIRTKRPEVADHFSCFALGK